jgi:Predicted ATPase
MSERKQLEQAIAAQESMRASLGDDVVDAAIAALREKLAALAPETGRRKMRGVEGVETRMIGRRGELDRLMDAMQTVLEDRELQAVTIIGDAGLGKSRLLYEFSNQVELLEETVLVFNGRAKSDAAPYSLLRDLFSSRFEIQESDAPEVARQKLERGILSFGGESAESIARAHFIGHLIGLDFSESQHLSGILDNVKQIRDRAFHYAIQFFKAAARVSPVALYLDDIQWADDGSLDFINHLTWTCGLSPILIVCLARQTLFERRPSWGEGETAHTRITLQPLSKRESRQLVEEILRRADVVPQSLREMLVAGGEGNPFYLEELIKMLIDQRVIVPGAQEWHVDDARLARVSVPQTLTGVLLARLDALSPVEKNVLERASVVGRTFWDSAIERLGTAETAAVLNQAARLTTLEVLGTLRRKELIYRREASVFAGAREYIFKHAILRDVTYENMPAIERHRYHKEMAGWLIERSGGRVSEYAGLIAEHYEQANEMAAAVKWYGSAGEQARRAYAPATAIGYYRKALEFLPDPSMAEAHDESNRAERLKWYRGLAEVLLMQSWFEGALEAYQEMRTLAEALGDVVAQACAWNGMAAVHDKQGDYRAMLESAKRAEQFASKATNAEAVAQRALALIQQGWAVYRHGDAATMLKLGEESLALSAKLVDEGRGERAGSLRMLGVAHHALGHFAQSEEYDKQALALYQELGNRLYVALTLNSMGEAARLHGDYQKAIPLYSEALAIAREIGERFGQMMHLSNLGGARLGLGDYVAAERDLREVIEMVGKTEYGGLSETYRFLAEACLYQGKVIEALEAARAALREGIATETQEFIGAAWRVLGQVTARFPALAAIEDAQTRDAEGCFKESLRIFTEFGMEAERARTLREWARYEEERGDTESAEVMSKEAVEIFERLGMRFEVARMKG